MKIMCIVFIFGLFCFPFNLNTLHCTKVTWTHMLADWNKDVVKESLQVNKVCVCVVLFARVFVLLRVCPLQLPRHPHLLWHSTFVLYALVGIFNQ